MADSGVIGCSILSPGIEMDRTPSGFSVGPDLSAALCGGFLVRTPPPTTVPVDPVDLSQASDACSTSYLFSLISSPLHAGGDPQIERAQRLLHPFITMNLHGAHVRSMERPEWNKYVSIATHVCQTCATGKRQGACRVKMVRFRVKVSGNPL